MHSPRTTKFKTSTSMKKSWRPFSGTEKAFSCSTSCLLAQQLMPLHIVTPWHGFHEPFKTKVGIVVTRRVPAPRQHAAPFRARHHCASVKIQVGYIGPSAIQSGTRASNLPLVPSPKEMSRWEKVQRRCRGAGRSHDVVQRAGGRCLWLGDTKAGSKT